MDCIPISYRSAKITKFKTPGLYFPLALPWVPTDHRCTSMGSSNVVAIFQVNTMMDSASTVDFSTNSIFKCRPFRHDFPFVQDSQKPKPIQPSIHPSKTIQSSFFFLLPLPVPSLPIPTTTPLLQARSPHRPNPPPNPHRHPPPRPPHTSKARKPTERKHDPETHLHRRVILHRSTEINPFEILLDSVVGDDAHVELLFGGVQA